jgi:hypothetical protein
MDTVIFVTGYRPNPDYLDPLGALDEQGQPEHRHGMSNTVPGLGFVGFSNQHTFASAALRGVGPDAAVVLRALRRQRQPERKDLRSLWREACCPAGTPARALDAVRAAAYIGLHQYRRRAS